MPVEVAATNSATADVCGDLRAASGADQVHLDRPRPGRGASQAAARRARSSSVRCGGRVSRQARGGEVAQSRGRGSTARDRVQVGHRRQPEPGDTLRASARDGAPDRRVGRRTGSAQICATGTVNSLSVPQPGSRRRRRSAARPGSRAGRAVRWWCTPSGSCSAAAPSSATRSPDRPGALTAGATGGPGPQPHDGPRPPTSSRGHRDRHAAGQGSTKLGSLARPRRSRAPSPRSRA